MSGSVSMLQGLTISERRRHQAIGAMLILLVWEGFGRMTSDLALTPVSSVVVRFVDIYISGVIYEPLFHSLQQFLLGFVLASIVALVVGISMGMSDSIEYLLDTYTNVMFVTSVSSMLPLLIIYFGTRLRFRVAVVFLFCVFHMIFNFKAGIENVDQDLIDAGRVFGASNLKFYRYVMIPASLPFIISGLRMGIGRSWKGMVVAELWIVAGIGGLLTGYQRSLQIDSVLVIVLTLMFLGYASVKGLYWVEKKVAPWSSSDTN